MISTLSIKYEQIKADAKKAICKKGKPCGDVCIPKKAECGNNKTSATTLEEKSQTPTQNNTVALGGTAIALAATYLGLSVLDKEYKVMDRSVMLAASEWHKFANDPSKNWDKDIDQMPIPDALKSNAKALVGASKAFAVSQLLEKQGSKLVSIDSKNNFSTYEKPDGSLFSVGSSGSTLFTFGSSKTDTVNGFPVFEMGFKINDQYGRKEGGEADRKKAVTLIRMAQGSFDEHLKHLPENTILKCKAHKEDDAGEKRQNIYEKKGFSSLPLRGNYIWALKNQGQFSGIPENQKEYIAKLLKRETLDSSPTKYEQIKSDAKKAVCKKGKPCGDVCIPKKAECGGVKKNNITAVANIAEDKEFHSQLARYGFIGGGVAISTIMAGVANQVAQDLNKITVKPSEEEKTVNYDDFTPGDLIRKRTNFVGADVYHYAVYAGKDPERGHQIIHTQAPELSEAAVSAVVKSSISQKNQELESGSIDNSNSAKYPDGPYIKVPESEMYQKEGTKRLSREEVLSRANKIVGSDYSFSTFSSNCETFARGIVEDAAYSTQGDAVSPLTRALGDFASEASAILSKPKYLDNKNRKTAAEIVEYLKGNSGAVKTDSQKENRSKNYEYMSVLNAIQLSQPKTQIDTICDKFGVKRPEDYSAMVEVLVKSLGTTKKATQIKMYSDYAKVFFGVLRSDDILKSDPRKDTLKWLIVNTRTDKKSVCKKGKPCGDICIPKKSKCGSKKTVTKPKRNRSDITNDKDFLASLSRYGFIGGGVVVSAILSGVVAQVVYDINKIAPPVAAKEEKAVNYDDFQPGDLIRKREIIGAPEAYHYAVYVGKNEKGEHQAIQAKALSSISKVSFSKEDSGSIYSKVPESEMYQKEGTRKISREEVLERVNRVIGTDYTYQVFSSNCETFARGIVESLAYSTQSDAVSPLTRVLGDFASDGLSVFARPKELFANKNRKTGAQIVDYLKSQPSEPTARKDSATNSKSNNDYEYINTLETKLQLRSTNKIDNYCDFVGIKRPESYAAMIVALSEPLGSLKKATQIKMYADYLKVFFGTIKSDEILDGKSEQNSRHKQIKADAKKAICKKGKPCGDVCIPKASQCKPEEKGGDKSDDSTINPATKQPYTIRELKEQAKGAGISYYSRMTSEELRGALKVANESDDQQVRLAKTLSADRSPAGRIAARLSNKTKPEQNIKKALQTWSGVEKLARFANGMPGNWGIAAFGAFILGTTSRLYLNTKSDYQSKFADSARAAEERAMGVPVDHVSKENIAFVVGGFKGEGHHAAKLQELMEQDKELSQKNHYIPFENKEFDIPESPVSKKNADGSYNAAYLGHVASQGMGQFYKNYTRKQNDDAVELAAQIYAHATKRNLSNNQMGHKDKMINIIAAGEGNLSVNEALEILSRMKPHGSDLMKRINVVSLGGSDFGMTEPNLAKNYRTITSSQDPFSALPKRNPQWVSSVKGHEPSDYLADDEVREQVRRAFGYYDNSAVAKEQTQKRKRKPAAKSAKPKPANTESKPKPTSKPKKKSEG